MGPGWILGACCLLIGPIYLNLSLPRFGSLFLDPALPRSCAGFPSVLHATCGASYGATSSVGWMDYLPIAIAPLPPFGSICIPIEHLASGGPDYGDGESRMVVAQEMEG